MAGAFVQQWGAFSTTFVTTITVDVNTIGATANNLLVAHLGVKDKYNGDGATGWTAIQDHTTANDTCTGGLFYRIATGDANDNFSPSWATGNKAAATVCEYSGLDSSSPLEDSDENATYVESGQTSGDPINAGSATPTSANGLAITGINASDERIAGDAELSIDNSYTRRTVYSQGGAVLSACMGDKAYTTTAAQSPNWDTTSSSTWFAYTTLAVFKEASSGTTVTGTLETLTLTEYAATITAATATNVTGTLETLTLTEFVATINARTSVTGTLETLTFTEYQADVSIGTNITGTLETLTFTEFPATINAQTNVIGTLETLTFTEYPATISEGFVTNVTGTLETLTLTEYPAVISYTLGVYASLETLTLTTFKADISYTSLEVEQPTGGWDYPQRPDARKERERLGIIEPEKPIKPVKSVKKIPTEFKQIKSLEQAQAKEQELQELQRLHETIKRRGLKKAQKEQLDREVLIKITLAFNALEQQKQLIEEQDIIFVMMMLAA